jgi:hypothetical protein
VGRTELGDEVMRPSCFDLNGVPSCGTLFEASVNKVAYFLHYPGASQAKPQGGVRHATKVTEEKYCLVAAMLRKKRFSASCYSHGRRYCLLTSFAMQDNLPNGELLAGPQS